MQTDISAQRKHHSNFPKYPDFPVFLNATLRKNILHKIFVLSVIIFNFHPENYMQKQPPHLHRTRQAKRLQRCRHQSRWSPLF